ncbi:structural maintenance of chromosomes 5 [Brachionus plicatilis]|uniref:Structural maintenance of chromosomes protein 5 n=1 Tax=Brachionus plicatilis TaxID=10195 RepID=A0A3M7PJJ5_BRAPC|nr:structural maintenance of chromosomes 5 [Brachionus plicatilis]
MNKSRSQKETSKLYAHGSIIRIKLENFVTYDSLEFSPQPNLNVIIGPNGTGKSTIVCAICLGMTGKPSVLGRASNIADFIKYGKNKATIEIELNNENGTNFCIRRCILKDNRSEWFLNNKPTKVKEIEDLVNELNIQVSNLCQFLPQEKVSEFARMNPQELLENTEKAVGGLDLFETHMELKDRSKLSKDLEKEVKNIEEQLKKEESINNRLESQVSSFMEKRKHEENIIWLKRKRSVLIYKNSRYEFEKAKKDQEKVVQELNALIEKNEALQEKKNEIDKKLNKQKNLLSSKISQIQEASRSGRDINLKLEDFNEKINDLKIDYQNKENESKNHEKKLKEIQLSIEALKTEYEESESDLEAIQKNEVLIRQKEADLRQQNEKLSNKEYEAKREMARLRSELEEIQYKIRDMKNVKQEKLNKLLQRSKDVSSAINWLEKNRGNFKGNVYEPMFLNMNIKFQESAKYVESLIPYRDLVQMFLFENSDDMHYFLSEVRDRLNLIVNAGLIPRKSLNSFMPTKPIEEIKKYGFLSYMREVIDAPEPILIYLCLYHNIHQVPLGTEQTQRNLSQYLPAIQEFGRVYTSTHQYSFSRSRYTNKISSSSTEVSESFWLTSSIDLTRLSHYEDREAEIKNKLKELDAGLQKIIEEKQKVDKMMENYRAELGKLRERKYHIDNLRKKLNQKESVYKSLATQNTDLTGEARNILTKVAEFSKKKSKLFADYVQAARNLAILTKDKVLCVYQDALYQNEKLRLENDWRVYLSQKQEIEAKLEQFKAVTQQAKDEAKSSLETASRINEINLENGLPANYKERFFNLPDSVEALNSEINQCQIIAQCAYDVDEKVIQEFENRKKLISQLQKDLEKKSKKLSDHQSNYENMKDSWLQRVDEMINGINVKFTALFMQLKCAGEISLSRPDNSEEFNKYGICIKVSFRTGEKLQELTAWQQSGGEKSVSTMLYMIALQEMTRCPFRVVDEINQGMDPVNERKVFDIIVQNSCSKHQAQYFLLTPKLLPDLAFDDKTNVICVFNGPENLPHSKYSLKEFVRRRKALNEKNA